MLMQRENEQAEGLQILTFIGRFQVTSRQVKGLIIRVGSEKQTVIMS